jgi:hypothetical protein
MSLSAQIFSMHTNGIPQRYIAAMLGIGRSSVSRVIADTKASSARPYRTTPSRRSREVLAECSPPARHADTRLATQIVASYRMGESLIFALDDGKLEASTAWRLPSHPRSEIIGILQSRFERAKALLSDHVSILNSLINYLLETRTEADEVATIFHGCTRTSE